MATSSVKSVSLLDFLRLSLKEFLDSSHTYEQHEEMLPGRSRLGRKFGVVTDFEGLSSCSPGLFALLIHEIQEAFRGLCAELPGDKLELYLKVITVDSFSNLGDYDEYPTFDLETSIKYVFQEFLDVDGVKLCVIIAPEFWESLLFGLEESSEKVHAPFLVSGGAGVVGDAVYSALKFLKDGILADSCSGTCALVLMEDCYKALAHLFDLRISSIATSRSTKRAIESYQTRHFPQLISPQPHREGVCVNTPLPHGFANSFSPPSAKLSAVYKEEISALCDEALKSILAVANVDQTAAKAKSPSLSAEGGMMRENPEILPSTYSSIISNISSSRGNDAHSPSKRCVSQNLLPKDLPSFSSNTQEVRNEALLKLTHTYNQQPKNSLNSTETNRCTSVLLQAPPAPSLPSSCIKYQNDSSKSSDFLLKLLPARLLAPTYTHASVPPSSVDPFFFNHRFTLLHGARGSGKSLLLRSLTSKSLASHPFATFSLQPGDVMRAGYGESQEILSGIFLEASRPPGRSLIVIDDVEVFFGMEKMTSSFLSNILKHFLRLFDEIVEKTAQICIFVSCQCDVKQLPRELLSRVDHFIEIKKEN